LISSRKESLEHFFSAQLIIFKLYNPGSLFRLSSGSGKFCNLIFPKQKEKFCSLTQNENGEKGLSKKTVFGGRKVDFNVDYFQPEN